MVDQVTRCQEMGLNAAFVGELQTDQFVKDNVINGKYSIFSNSRICRRLKLEDGFVF